MPARLTLTLTKPNPNPIPNPNPNANPNANPDQVERVREHVGASTDTPATLRGPLIAPEAAAFEQALRDIGEM